MRFLFYILILGSTSYSFSQSIHQTELINHNYEVGNVIAKQKPVKGPQKSNCFLNKTVFGWHPYWMNGAEVNYEWDLLSDLCFFGYEVNPNNGNPISTHGFATNVAVDSALYNGTNVHLCTILFSNHATFFNSTLAQTTLINNLISMIQSRGANGINIDFEGVPSSLSSSLTSFMTNLSNALHATNPNYKLSMCLYAVDWNNVFNEPALSNVVDFFTLMGYDYYYSGSSQAGPNDPLYSFSNSFDYSLSRSISYYLNAGIPASKLILGLPYYGMEWETISNSIPSNTTGSNVFSRTFDMVNNNNSGNYSNGMYHNRSASKSYIFLNAGTWRQCWITEENEMRERFDLVNRRSLMGIGIWALGYDDGHDEFWSAIGDKLTSCNVWQCSDTLYDEGGPESNYYNNELVQYTISPPNAQSIQVDFIEFSTELNYDTLWLYDGNSVNAPLIGAFHGTNGPGQFSTSTGDLTVRFKSDGSIRSAGWKMLYNCIQDTIAPYVTSNLVEPWQSENTTIQFTENDNFQVVSKFWNAQSWDQSTWRSNTLHGHCHDDFSLITNWVSFTGNWSYDNGKIKQNDESNGNTNFSLSVPTLNNNSILVHFKASISGGGTNRRGGIHFMCSDLSLTNRGDSYFVWFRVDSDLIQFYKVENDVFSLVASFPHIINPDTIYDCKVVYSSVTGKSEIFVNDVFVGSWVDSVPLNSGNGISFRSGNSILEVDEVSVFVGRDSNENLFVGSNGHFFVNNQNPQTSAGKISNIVIDNSNNLGKSEQTFNVDFTPPLLNVPFDGVADIDSLINLDILQLSNLYAEDTNSGIYEIYCSIVDDNNNDVIAPFYVITPDTVKVIDDLIDGEFYRIKMVAENHAGLNDSIYSDGFLYLPTLNTFESEEEITCVYPNPFKDNVIIMSKTIFVLSIFDSNLKLIEKVQINEGLNEINCSNWSDGIYFLLGRKSMTKIVRQ